MKKIERYTAGWCDIDRLGGIDLVDGERLRIKFKDKTIKVMKIKVETGSYTANDMWHEVECPTSKAFITEKIRGMTVKIPLVGLMAERLDPPPVFEKRKRKYPVR